MIQWTGFVQLRPGRCKTILGNRRPVQVMATTAVGKLTIWAIVALVGIVILALALGNQ
jgi:hypothetical protein